VATTAKWVAPDTLTSILTTELNSLANAGLSALGTEVNNETDLAIYGDFELVLASLTPTGTPYVALYLVPAVDNTPTYPDTAASFLPIYLATQFPLATGAAAKRSTIVNIPIPPLKFKVLIENRTGVAFAASGNTLKIRKHNEQSV
jgi:hypothetical protein